MDLKNREYMKYLHNLGVVLVKDKMRENYKNHSHV